MREDEHDTSGSGDRAGQERSEQWNCDRAAVLELSLQRGRIEITLGEEPAVQVRVRPDPEQPSGWGEGLSRLLGGDLARDLRDLGLGLGRGLGANLGVDLGRDLGANLDLGRDLAAEAVAACQIDWVDGQLVVRSSDDPVLRSIPLVVTVRAPAGSMPRLRIGAARVEVSGRAGNTSVRVGSGEITVDAVDGDVELVTGSGSVRLGPVHGRPRAAAGSGTRPVTEGGGTTEIRTGSGDVHLSGVRADVFARTGSGDLMIDDAESGRLELSTGSGDMRVGVHAGVAAELDLSSGSGHTRSELEVDRTAPPTSPALVVRGRTGSGDVVITRATARVG